MMTKATLLSLISLLGFLSLTNAAVLNDFGLTKRCPPDSNYPPPATSGNDTVTFESTPSTSSYVAVTNITAASQQNTTGPNYASAVMVQAGSINTDIVYYPDIDGYIVVFKPDMGPGSAWFAENFPDASDEPFEGDNATEITYVHDYQDDATPNPDNSSSSDIKVSYRWTPYHSTHRIKYGNASPESIIQHLGKSCYKSSCTSDSNFRVNIKYLQGTASCGATVGDGYMQVKPTGTFSPNARGYYVKALSVIARAKAKKNEGHWEACGFNPCTGQCVCDGQKHNIAQWRGGSYFSMNRYAYNHHKKLGMTGNINAAVSFHTDGADACNAIVQAIEAIASAGGPIGAIGSGFFGDFLNNHICSNS